MGWACSACRWGEGVYRVLVGKPEGKRPLGRSRRRWVNNIRMDLQEVGCGYMEWIGLAHDRDRWRTLVSAVMNLRVPWNAGNFLTSCKPVSYSRRTLHHAVSMYVCLEYLSRRFKFHWYLTRTTDTLHQDLYTFLIITHWIFLRMRNVANKGYREYQNTYCSKTNFRKSCL